MNCNLLYECFYYLDFINVTLVSDDQRFFFSKRHREESVINNKRYFKNESIKLALILLSAVELLIKG